MAKNHFFFLSFTFYETNMTLYVWSMGVLLFLLREIQMSTQVIWEYFRNKCQNKVNFPDVIFNFSNMVCVLPSTLCMTGELWPRRLICHQDIRVTHCQSSAKSFILTQYSFCNSFRHGIICQLYPESLNICQLCPESLNTCQLGPESILRKSMMYLTLDNRYFLHCFTLRF